MPHALACCFENPIAAAWNLTGVSMLRVLMLGGGNDDFIPCQPAVNKRATEVMQEQCAEQMAATLPVSLPRPIAAAKKAAASG